ncbi:MAG: hypothetical protein ACK526_07370 [Planctomyces sp.]|jgi:hypothetical protein
MSLNRRKYLSRCSFFLSGIVRDDSAQLFESRVIIPGAAVSLTLYLALHFLLRLS